MTTRMGFPALTIPLLKIVPKKSKEKEVKSQPVKKKVHTAERRLMPNPLFPLIN